MGTVADIIHAIDEEGSTSWAIADQVAALDELDETTGKPLTLAQVSDRIRGTRGVEWSPNVLSKYRTTALAFPPSDVTARSHPFTVAKELRAHPDKLREWKPTKKGDVLTQERAAALRGRSTASKMTQPLPGRVKAALTRLEALVEEDPEFVLDTIDAMSAQWRRSFASRIEKLRRRGLAAVAN